MEPQSGYRHFQAVSEGLRGPFGKWLLEYFRETSNEVLGNAARILPESIKDEYEREQLIGKANALADLVSDIPTIINDKLKEAQQQEVDKT